MKKSYIMPAVTVVSVQTVKMIAQSQIQTGGDWAEGTAASRGGSRGSSSWDDEE